MVKKQVAFGFKLLMVIIILVTLTGCGKLSNLLKLPPLSNGSQPETIENQSPIVSSSSITGILIDSFSKPVQNADVTLYRITIQATHLKTASAIIKTAKTDSNGLFTLSEISSGNYYLLADDGNGHKAQKAEIKIQDTNINLGVLILKNTGQITGSIKLSCTSNSQGIFVYLSGTSSVSITGSSGAFILSNVIEGTYTLAIEKSGYTIVTKNVAVKVNDTTIISEINLTKISVQKEFTLTPTINDLD